MRRIRNQIDRWAKPGKGENLVGHAAALLAAMVLFMVSAPLITDPALLSAEVTSLCHSAGKLRAPVDDEIESLQNARAIWRCRSSQQR